MNVELLDAVSFLGAELELDANFKLALELELGANFIVSRSWSFGTKSVVSSVALGGECYKKKEYSDGQMELMDAVSSFIRNQSQSLKLIFTFL